MKIYYEPELTIRLTKDDKEWLEKFIEIEFGSIDEFKEIDENQMIEIEFTKKRRKYIPLFLNPGGNVEIIELFTKEEIEDILF